MIPSLKRPSVGTSNESAAIPSAFAAKQHSLSVSQKIWNSKHSRSLCTASPVLLKKSERSVCDLPLMIVFKDHVTFSGMIWLVISHTSLHHWNSEIWLAFIFAGFAIGAFCTESFTFVRDNNMMWDFDDEFVCSLWRRHRKKKRIKILLMDEGAILLKFENFPKQTSLKRVTKRNMCVKLLLSL